MSTPNFESFATKELVKEVEYRLDLKIEQTKVELTKAIYQVNLIQYITLAATIIGIISFIIKK